MPSAVVAPSLIATVVGLGLQFALSQDMWDTCPGTNHPDGWERRMNAGVLRAEATCTYLDPKAGREVDHNGFTMFDRVRGIF